MTELPTYPAERKALHKALAQAQGEFPTIPKDQTADAGSYTYAYADLAAIIHLVRPVLAKHGLALIQRLENPNGQPAIRTELLHADGASLAASFPIGDIPQNVQQLGSKITYLRRYTIVAMLGIAAGEDDDGRQAAAPAKDTTATAGAEPSPFQPPDLKTDVVEDLSSAQRKKIFAIRTKLLDAGRFTDEEFKARLLEHFGVDSVSGLSKDQASTLITWLLAAEAAVDEGGAAP
jgi:ERF superfamily